MGAHWLPESMIRNDVVNLFSGETWNASTKETMLPPALHGALSRVSKEEHPDDYEEELFKSRAKIHLYEWRN